MKAVLMCAKCVFWPLNKTKLAVVGNVRASPIQENRTLMSKKYLNQSLSTFFRGQGIKISPESMKTVLQCVKCVFWPLKWSKLAIVGTVRASPIQENPTLMSKKYLNKSLSSFFRGYGIKTSPEIMKTVLQCAKCVFWPLKCQNLLFLAPLGHHPSKKTQL